MIYVVSVCFEKIKRICKLIILLLLQTGYQPSNWERYVYSVECPSYKIVLLLDFQDIVAGWSRRSVLLKTDMGLIFHFQRNNNEVCFYGQGGV